MLKDINCKTGPIEIDLTGSEGNAFVLLGMVSNFCEQLQHFDKNKIRQEMMGGDYENLLQVFDGYFGEFIIMYR